ncbi:uncharacterized protein [Magallana gigas]|uniref:uncharacterized protein n=1 Tax=Magallana gigas TaxID=29159 RepID=UPI00333EE9B8
MAEHYELEPIDQDDPQQEYFYIHTEEVRLNTETLTDNNGKYSDIRDPPNAPVNYRILAIAAILFIVLLVLLFYWLSIFFTKNQDSADKTQNITNMQGKVKYLLPIRYTDYVKEIDDTTRNCTKMHNDAYEPSFSKEN